METPSDPQDWLDIMLRQAQPWISECLSNHSECRSTTPRAVPTRLVDVGPSDGSKDPFLFVPSAPCYTPLENQESWASPPDATLRYLALSYCWGDKENLMTTPDNLELRRAGIPWAEIPRTIQDAILVTRKLGFRYLWLDALCILQGPDGDWVTESANMAEIYGGAFLTISAAISPNVQHGFQQSLKKWSHNLKYKVLDPSVNPLYLRGWALQERILSRRLLIFGDKGMYWECQEYDSRSTIQRRCLPYIPRFYSLRLKPDCLPRDWITIVEDYRNRSLTLERDTLPALSGLATLYHQFTKHDYLAGMWKQSLIHELLWRTSYSATDVASQSLTGRPLVFQRSSNSTAPSWSWASVNRPIHNSSRHFEANTTKVLDAQIELKDPKAPFGEVVGGSITLCGPLVSDSEVDMQMDTAWVPCRDENGTPWCQRKIWYMLLGMDV